MKSTNITLPKELKELRVYVFSDWHIGDNNCNIQEIREQVEIVKNDPSAYCILNGDLMNNATKASVSDSYAENMSPMEQLQYLNELLAPIKKKILCATAGNHENRTYRNDGIDLTGVLCKELGIEDRYGREGVFLFLRFGTSKRDSSRNLVYRIYCTHGSGGGRKEGAKAIRLADMASIITSDIYIHSHTHLPMVMRNVSYETDTRSNSIIEVDRLFVNTAASLKYGGYGQAYEFKPSSTVTPIIHISGSTKKYWATL